MLWGREGIGGLLSMRQNGEDYFYLYDGKGNVTTVVDSSQQVVATYQHNAFGRLMSTIGSLEQPFQFSSKRYDAGTGLNYYGYRFYASAIERWLNRDSRGEAEELICMGFVRNDQVNYINPNGQFIFTLTFGVTAWAIAGDAAVIGDILWGIQDHSGVQAPYQMG